MMKYIKHTHFSGTWLVKAETKRRDTKYYVCQANSTAYHQRLLTVEHCTEISEEEYDRGFVPAPNYKEIFA